MVEESEWEKLEKMNVEFLDTLDLPVPESGEDISDYMDRVDEKFKGIEMPEELDGYIFNYMDQISLGEYLSKRFDMQYTEEIKWVMY